MDDCIIELPECAGFIVTNNEHIFGFGPTIENTWKRARPHFDDDQFLSRFGLVTLRASAEVLHRAEHGFEAHSWVKRNDIAYMPWEYPRTGKPS